MTEIQYKDSDKRACEVDDPAALQAAADLFASLQNQFQTYATKAASGEPLDQLQKEGLTSGNILRQAEPLYNAVGEKLYAAQPQRALKAESLGYDLIDLVVGHLDSATGDALRIQNGLVKDELAIRKTVPPANCANSNPKISR
jgi:hypothetical protein